jgi:hypothetical protein
VPEVSHAGGRAGAKSSELVVEELYRRHRLEVANRRWAQIDRARPPAPIQATLGFDLITADEESLCIEDRSSRDCASSPMLASLPRLRARISVKRA